MFRRLPISTRTDTPLPYTTLFRSTEGVSAPRWFIELLPLAPHDAQRQVSDGWRQVGMVHLRAADGYARDVLWHSTLRIVALTVGAGILWALFVMVLMRWLRRALHEEVMERVRAMAENRAPAPLQPRARSAERRVGKGFVSTCRHRGGA